MRRSGFLDTRFDSFGGAGEPKFRSSRFNFGPVRTGRDDFDCVGEADDEPFVFVVPAGEASIEGCRKAPSGGIEMDDGSL